MTPRRGQERDGICIYAVLRRRAEVSRDRSAQQPQGPDSAERAQKNCGPTDKYSGNIRFLARPRYSEQATYRASSYFSPHGHRACRAITKHLRKRYGTYDSRGRLAGKRHISTEWRRGDWCSDARTWNCNRDDADAAVESYARATDGGALLVWAPWLEHLRVGATSLRSRAPQESRELMHAS